MFEIIFGKDLVRVISLIKPRQIRYFTGIVIMSVLTAFLSVGEAYTIKIVANAILTRNSATFFKGFYLFLFVVLIVITLFPVFTWMYNKSAKLTGAKAWNLFYEKLLRLPIPYFDANHSGEIIARMNNGILAIEQIYGGKLRRFLNPIISSAVIIVSMLLIHWKIAILLILLNLLYVAINTVYAKPIRQISETLLNNMGTLTQQALNIVAGYSTVKIFHLDAILTAKYARLNRELKSNLIKRQVVEGLLDSTNYLLTMVNSVGVIILGYMMALRYAMDIGSLLALINIQSRLNGSFLSLARYIPIMQESLAGVRRVFDFLDETPEPDTRTVAQCTNRIKSIELRNVCFGYNNAEKIFEQVSLKINEGEIIAIIGQSGSGKSTILKLLLRYYPVHSGELLINGEPIEHYSMEDVRNLIAYVPQEPFLFNGTIEENIRYGNLRASREQVMAAARAAYAHEFIKNLPEGYQTHIGERGAALSGGQRQRLAIARAILKDAPLLLLDEATSALDSRSEQYVQQALESLMKGRTTIIVAHRLSTIRHAHRVYKMNRGQLVEELKKAL
ncbi:MAG TPA: ABC transporter ATP-binding protein [Bacillota bacterium]|nr:ABC transporter ATP-binding protein [Bacillota bacterium]